ncbi:sensor histidine kinase [Psychrobacillus glaciei]|uniref:histidine kinase n=1 Tax=Psychrobacillus glaciei TaxID=2283160 RepID=A0A5J6SLN2_9BACI|nr:HAMP domain-containing sensor histidine kinase [Psychrobacillus glaciei]QFF98413.1 sensor histidine kinase [Psychrobacillus glaciei]
MRKNKLLHSIYVRFVLIFVGVLFFSSTLSFGIITTIHLGSIKADVQNQLIDRTKTIQKLVINKKTPINEAVSYFKGDSNILVFNNIEKLLSDKRLTSLSSVSADLKDGKIISGELTGKAAWPFSAVYLNEHYLVVLPNMENNQIDKFRNTAKTYLLTTILLGSLLTLLAVSMIVKPIKAITKASIEVANGHFDIRIKEKGNDEVTELARNFNIMAKELKANEYLHKEFVSSVSHEFKTPITSIHGFGKLLKDKQTSEELREEYLDIIIAESERLSKLSTNLLLLTELDHQVNILQKGSFSLDEQIRTVLLLLQEQWDHKNIELEVDLEEVSFIGNEELLQQVWINLMVNAIKFTANAGTISVKLKVRDDFILASISDNGIGIAESEQEIIFDRFYKADKSRSTSGTGLGLSIVKNIVQLHKGRVWVESELGDGSTFYVQLKKMAT